MRLADKRERDDEFLASLLDAIDDDLDVALDLRDPSWDGIEPELDAVGARSRVNQLDGTRRASGTCACASRPTTTPRSTASAATIRRLLDGGLDVYCYFRHEDEPTAPAYAARLRELVSG